MAELKTKATDASVEKFLSKVAPPVRQEECRALDALMRRATGETPRMWGAAMVGYGAFHYKYGSGREADWLATGFSPRKQSLTVYLMDGCAHHSKALATLGKHTSSVSCLYIKKLADIDLKVLEEVVKASFTRVRKGLEIPTRK